MSRIHRRLLLVIVVATCLAGLAGTGAWAGLALGSHPSEATENSIYNILATWQDSDGVAPVLDRSTITEPMIDWGLRSDGEWAATIGTPRGSLPAEWSDSLLWYPALPAPDGFIGFDVPFDADFNDLSKPGEQYQAFGYATIQPDPQYLDLETSDNPAFDHGLDLELEEIIPKDDGYLDVGLPLADGTLPYMACPAKDAISGAPATAKTCTFADVDDTITSPAHGLVTGDLVSFESISEAVSGTPDVTGIVLLMPYYVIRTSQDTFQVASTAVLAAAGTALPLTGNGSGKYLGKDILPRPATPAIIVTSKVPIILVGVWSDSGDPVKARIRSAAEIWPADENSPGWPNYNIIEVLESKTTVATIRSYKVSYYTPGTTYVATQQGPLPMPYTLYRIPAAIGADGVPYLPINDGILTLDPDFVNPDDGRLTVDLNDPNLEAQLLADPALRQRDICPIIGIYATQYGEHGNPNDPQTDTTNYFDITTPDQPALRYEAPDTPGAMHPTFGKLFFTSPPANVSAGTFFYVQVSTNAVSGVYPSEDEGRPNNLYINYLDENATPKVIGYCAKSGIIRLARPCDDPPQTKIGVVDGEDRSTAVAGQKLYVRYRKLSNTTVTVGRTANVGLVDDLTDVAPANAGFVRDFNSADARPDVPRGKFVIDTKTLPTSTYAVGVRYWQMFPIVNADPNGGPGTLDPYGVVWYKGSIPMRSRQPGTIIGGMKYGVSVSRGLKMSNIEQRPSADVTLNVPSLNNKLIYDDYLWPMYYDGDLTGSDAPVSVHRITAVGYGVKNRQLMAYEIKVSDNVNVTVHSGATALHCWGDSSQAPATWDVDPLAVEPLNEANPTYPDDGSGSTQFVFRVRYVRNNTVGVLPPLPWMRPQADAWNPYNFNSGVVLYLDENGTGDYKPHFMQPDYESNGLGANQYIYRVIPHNAMALLNTQVVAPWMFQYGNLDVDNHLYQSLQMGVYHYFFGTSSDSLRFCNNNGVFTTFAFENQHPDPMDPNDELSKTGLEEWGQIASPPYYSTGLDPSAPRAVTGYPRVDRAAGRRYSTNEQQINDTSLYVNRTCRAPGAFEGTYKYPYVSKEHPRVTCELRMPSVDDFQKRYDHLDYGEGRFFGTLFPFRSALNPAHPGVRGGGTTHMLAETSGSYSTDTNEFRIMYRQIDNKAPISIKLWINNASEKSGPASTHKYTGYTMQRKPNQTNPDYRKGVWYEYKLQSNTMQLPYGPHTYYFTADDGEHTVRWPVRPDHYQYDWPGPSPDAGQMNIIDWWTPTASFAYENRNPDYYDNDYVSGPYVNRAPEISNVSVTPGLGKEGTHFVYSATYKDLDGQRPYSATVWIRYSDGAEPRAFAMRPDPSLNIDPIADNSALYKAGVRYILDTATISDFALEKGVRAYYVTFTDDWGRQDDVNDRRKGEAVRYLPGEDNWIQGPVISGNTAPTLSNGRVTSHDNTANAATDWSFKVTYRDIDLDAPSVIKVYIGRLQPQDITTPTPSNKVKTIIWDAGHTMLLPPDTDPSGVLYHQGVEYTYNTKLAGPDTAAPQMVTKQMTLQTAASQIDPDPGRTGDIIRVWKVYTAADPNTNYYSYTGGTPPDYTGGMITLTGNIPAGDIYIQYERRPAVQYYYAFEAYDGVNYATYQSSSKAELRSDAAGCFIRQDAVSLDSPTNLHYKIRPKIAKPLTLTAPTTALDPDPQRIGDIVRIWGVYTNEDLTGTNYYPLPAGETVPPLYDNVTHPTITLTQQLLAGKIWLHVEADTPIVGPIPIATPAPAGVIPDAEVFINFTQDGTPQLLTDQENGFIDEFNPLVDRAVVFMRGQAALAGRPSKDYVGPDSPNDIASIEGVYWLSNPDHDHQYDNYYEPEKLIPPVLRNATPDPAQPYVYVEQPEDVFKVLGIYDNQNLTGLNYYAGDTSQLKWQPAFVLRDGMTRSPNVIWPSRPHDIAVVQGVFLSQNQSDPNGNFYAPDTDTARAMHVVPADVNGATGEITINPVYNMGGAIKAILRINGSADMSGTDYFLSVDPAGDPYDPAVPLVANQPAGAPTEGPVYVSYVPNVGFGAGKECLALRRELPEPTPTVYIAYYAPAALNAAGGAELSMPPPQPDSPMFAKIWAKGFNPGDQYIKLTTPLPDLSATGTPVNSGLIAPDPNKLSDIGAVTGVFVEADATNYYLNTPNPFSIGDTAIRLAQALPSPLPATVTIKYLPRERNVTIKYSDMRFTHTFPGSPRQILSFDYDSTADQLRWATMTTGSTHFVPDAGSFITGNAPIPSVDGPDITRDVDAGIVGIWQYPEFTGPNYFNPRRTSLFDDLPARVRLSTQAPVGSNRMYARAYQKGVYFIDRWNRDLRFDTSKVLTDLDRVQVSYFFGTRMTQVLVPNTLPVLSDGTVSPITGSRNTQYVYSIKYKDIDGPTGQMPTYVKVYIDGTAYNMTPLNQGTPDYKAGAIFTFTPTGGLSGKPHTFYFEASDGAAVAWFDKLGAHNSDRTAPVQDIVEIDGPWVNDPPSLTNGLVSPNPTGQGAGIGTTDSVDYRVTLVDLDNEPPYFFDPLRDAKGQAVTGSPRVWIDAGLSEDQNAPVTYTIIGLEADPSELTKQRVLKVGVPDGSGSYTSPNWTTDQFAGKLLQISNGQTWSDISPSPYLSVYLIQSNTSNKLLLAVDDLANDKLYPVPPDPTSGAARYAQFRINGLLMTKTDPTQLDNWATGVDYKITVPRLQVGLHKYHFTARTREDKPAWLLSTPGYENADPYSVMVRFPTLGDATGPNVISKPSDDNVPPVLMQVPTAPSRTLYRGPQAQAATVTTANSALPTDYNKLFTVLGVYRNANFDAHLSLEAPLAINQPKDFFDSAGMPANPPATGDPVRLTPNLYPVPDNMVLVQRASAVENLTTVVPEVPSAIGTVLAVYAGTDPALLYPSTVVSSTLPVDNRIRLNTTLPTGTTEAFITYRPKVASATLVADGTGFLTLPSANGIAYVKGVYLASDTDKTDNLTDPDTWAPGSSNIGYTGSVPADGTSVVVDYVPWPPIYLKYYAVEPAGSPTGNPPQVPYTHGPFKEGEPITFAIFYKDANGDRPTYHDGVQGYVKLVFNNLAGRTAQLSAMVPVTDYKIGAAYGVTLTDVPAGKYAYHFEASDGYVVTRYPADPTGTAPNDEKIHVNNKPVLSNAGVDHAAGAVSFAFSVTYRDADNVAPGAGGFVKATITSQTDPLISTTITLSPGASPNWYTGVVHTGSITVADAIPGGLPVGAYNVEFTANDGIQDAVPLGGVTITVREQDPNHRPYISDYAVYKLLPGGGFGGATGKTSDTFVYRARYKDSYDDPPVAVINGVRQTALYLVIDGNTAHPIAMTMVPQTGTPDYTGTDADRWPWWEARVTGKTLGGGNHNYTVWANDGTVNSEFEDGVLSIKYGPTLMIPYFALQAVGKDGSTISSQAIVGQEVLIKGQMYFPYTTGDQKPTDFSNIVIQVTKPDATVVSLSASLTVRKDPEPVGNPENWIGDIDVEYSGYVDPALATGSSLTLVSAGQWIIGASWMGDATYDGAQTDSVFDGRNDQVRVTVSGPSRTIATSNPLLPETSAPVVDMITPPMMIGSTSPSSIFGPDRALSMQIVKWAPANGQYFKYDVGGYFPPLRPGDAVWIKPKLGTTPGTGYPAAESISRDVVEGGWTALDNPAVQNADFGGDPRYLSSKYRLVKVLAQAYPLKTNGSGTVLFDDATQLPLFKPCTISMPKGWNQFGSIFFNWKRNWQVGTATPSDELPPPIPGEEQEYGLVTPTNPANISRVLGVYTTPNPGIEDLNYYQPGIADKPFARGDASIHLTRKLDGDVTNVYIKYEVYPREDVGIPIKEVKVSYLGVKKTLAEAKAAGWITDYAWRYDTNVHDYVAVSETRAGAERVLKAWSGYWIRAYVNCDLEIDPNTAYNGVTTLSTKSMSAAPLETAAEDDMIAPPPAPK